MFGVFPGQSPRRTSCPDGTTQQCIEMSNLQRRSRVAIDYESATPQNDIAWIPNVVWAVVGEMPNLPATPTTEVVGAMACMMAPLLAIPAPTIQVDQRDWPESDCQSNFLDPVDGKADLRKNVAACPHSIPEDEEEYDLQRDDERKQRSDTHSIFILLECDCLILLDCGGGCGRLNGRSRDLVMMSSHLLSSTCLRSLRGRTSVCTEILESIRCLS